MGYVFNRINAYLAAHPVWLERLFNFYPKAVFLNIAGLVLIVICSLLIIRRPAFLPDSRFTKPVLWTALVGFMLVSIGALGLRIITPMFIGEERFAVRLAMKARPDDPWPRSSGHVILGAFGSAETEKGYLEPGGSFSPALDTFGLSFWVTDRSGKLVASSDTLSLEQSRQSYTDASNGQASIITDTPYYRARWQVGTDARYVLKLSSKLKDGQQLKVSIRSVGPAGGRLERLEYRDQKLILTKGWTLEGIPAGALTYMGEEGQGNWMSDRSVVPDKAVSPSGWAHARFSVPEEGIELSLHGPPLSNSQSQPWQARTKLSGADQRFAASMAAQMVSLKLGIVRDETRPADPVNYPLQWQRDGAYIIVAMARSGQIDLAKALTLKFATSDFFGGFGVEADAPGLGLWAMGEVSKLAGDEDFDRQLWPHVVRKAALIIDMQNALTPIEKDNDGPLVPELSGDKFTSRQLASPSKDGLIIGRMDKHYPVFFVNSVSYSGLRAATLMAQRLDKADYAAVWTTRADGLRQSWRRAFTDQAWVSDRDNDRTAISGLWPSGIADHDPYEQFLEARWPTQWRPDGQPVNYPLWTYFTIAEAHQWVRLGRSERAWQVMEWFWSHQPAPGLYTFWESNKEENTFGLWQKTRGWVRPDSVTPHYWTAAEMLLMQLEMLAYVEGEEGRTQMVIGAGVPEIWLKQPFSAKRIGTSAGFVDWSWDGKAARITIHGRPLPVRLGKSFPKGTKTYVRYM